MRILESIKDRRSYYEIGRDLPISEEKVEEIVRTAIKYVPDSYNAQAQRAIVVMGDKQDELWDGIYQAFDGKVAREKIDGFKAGYGTILFFINREPIQELQKKFPNYAEKFDQWAYQAVGMLEYTVWVALREQGVGASLQHYNPVIDSLVQDMFGVDENWELNAQMPFGHILREPEQKDKIPVDERYSVVK